MKKILSLFTVFVLLFALVYPLLQIPAKALPGLPTVEFQGNTYYCVNTKAQYTQLVHYAIDNLLEEFLIYQDPKLVEYDTSWSNNVGNFNDYESYRELKFLDYNVNCVSGYCSEKPIFDETNCFVGMTPLAYGKLEIEYDDNKEELEKADGMIRNILTKFTGKTEKEKVEYVANYICSVAKAGSVQLPDGGYDLINGVYDVLTGHHTNVVCTSYTVTFQRFMEIAGMEAVMIHDSVNHIWNMVCVDGSWYGVDVTFGDEGSTMNKEYLLMGNEELKSYDFTGSITAFKKNHKLGDRSPYSSAPTTTTKAPTTTTKAPITTTKAPTTTTKAPTTTTKAPVTTLTPPVTTSKTEDLPESETDTPVEELPPVEVTPPAEEEKPSDSAPETETEKEENTEEKEITVEIVENTVVSTDIFQNAKENGEKVSLVGEGYRWSFKADTLIDSEEKKEFNAVIFVGEEVPEEAVTAIESATENKTAEVYPFSFSHHGKLPGVADITIEVDSKLSGKNVYIYYLNEKNEPVKAGEGTVKEDNTLTFSTDHCSVWFLSTEDLVPQEESGILWIVISVLLLAAAAVFGAFLYRRKQTAEENA